MNPETENENMSKVIAYALNRVERRGEKGKEIMKARTVFETDADTFKRLEKLNAVRRASNEEAALYRTEHARTGQSAVETEAPVASQTVDTIERKEVAPPSGAKGDPNGAPKKSASKPAKQTKAESEEDLIEI